MDNEKITVLLIEDNPGDARLIQEYLSESGSDIFRLERVDRLSLGLERFTKGDIGVILLDLTLPDSQRLEGLTKVLAKAPHVPVVVLSGVKDEKVAIEAVHAGAQDYLVKGSIDANLLVRLLRHAIERHRLRVALRQSESRYRLLAENIADVVWVADEKGWITYVSPSVERLLGYTAEEVERLRIRDILTVDSADQARRLTRNQIEVGVQQSRSSPLSLTLEHVRKDGSTVWAEVMLSFLLDKKGNFAGIMGSTRDVTARKIAEEALQRSEEHFRALIENASDAVLVMNEDLTLRYESPAVERMLGYRVEERIGRSGLEHVHPDDIRDANITKRVDRFLKESGAVMQSEVRVRHKDGSWRNIEVTGRNLLNNAMIRGVVVNFRDVTERRKAEEARRESEARFRTVFEGTGMAMALIDKKGIPLGINPAFSRMFGYSFEEFCSINNLKYLHPDDAMADAGLYMEMLKGKRDHYTIDKRYIRKNGEVLWGRQNLSAVRDVEGKPEYFIAMIEDITERKRMEEEIIALSNAFRATLDPVLILDMKGNVREANDAARRLFETDEPGVSALKYVAPEDKEKVTAVLQDLITSGTPGIAQFNIVTRTGRRVPLEASGSLILGVNKEPVGVVIVERDLTERRKMEEE
ncbi:MAG: PAS domain S-box protein, partial [Chloroflexi bacterium]|nr:PAS domain S-box protein [Chloroflexota bacterium]